MFTITNCPDCRVGPGNNHLPGCAIERCSCCGNQRSTCECVDHDPAFSRWSGIIPGLAESRYLGITIFEIEGELKTALFRKPRMDGFVIDLVNVNGVLDDDRAHLSTLPPDSPWRNPTQQVVDRERLRFRLAEARAITGRP